MDIKSPLQAQAYEHLKDMILSGNLKAGTLHSETKLSGELGISRTPMREALQCLSQDGYISIIPSKGFMIRQLNEKDMEETIQVRCAIEGFCTHVAAAEIQTPKGRRLLKDLGKCVEQMKKTSSANDSLKSFMDYDHKFHLTLVQYADNKEFNQLFQRLMYLIHLTTSTALTVPGRLEGTIEEHKQFYEHLSNGNGDQAYALLLKHLMAPISLHIINE